MDGLAMAFRYGLRLRDMEMVQFHPTGLLAGPHTRMTGTVLEEGLRGAGGYLLNGSGDRFMFDYDPDGERATRDIVSRALYAEMRGGRTTPGGGVYISMSHLGPDVVRDKFKGMVKRCEDCGFDLAAGRVEVVPTAHYLMGGITCDIDTATSVPGLFVAGEDAGGIHGANRLGGNGVANSTVYGGVAGDAMAVSDYGTATADADNTASGGGEAGDDVIDGGEGNEVIGGDSEVRAELLRTGVVGGRIFNVTWHDWLNLLSLLDIAEVIAAAARSRENSRGAHFREDFTGEGNLESSFFTVVRRAGDSIMADTEPVDFSLVRPGQTLIPESPEGVHG